VSCLVIKLESGVERYFEKELKTVIDFWESYFKEVIERI
jgi:hypothetical protein